MVLRKALPGQRFAIQMLRVMKIVAILFFAFCMQVSATGYSQTVTLQLKNASLTTIFTEIKNQTGYNFVYTKEDLQKANNIDIDVSHSPLEDVLQICFRNQPLTYTVVEKMVVIKQKKSTESNEANALPPGEIKGRITNAQGEPLAGANVINKHTNRGTQTNARGEFILYNANSGDVITVSYTGYKAQTIKLGNTTDLTLVMEIATNQLDKVVVQGYGTTTQRFNTGNIATVTAAEIEKQPVMNVLEALYGKVPGMVVTQQSGYASAPIHVEIRGRATIGSNFSDPLFIIDGVPLSLSGRGGAGIIQPTDDANMISGPANGQSPLFSVNPSDIESVTVLKDADATAIYGSRGANGVVIITTKKGRAGKTKLDVSFYQGFSKITHYYEMLNTQQYLAMRHEALRNDGIVADEGNAYDLLVWDTTRDVNLQKFFWDHPGQETDVQTGISGGDKQTTFRISAGYHRQTSIMHYSGAEERGSLSVNLNHKSLNQRLLVSFTSDYSYSYADLIGLSGSTVTAPNTPAIFDENGKLNYAGWAPISSSFNYGSLLSPYVAKTRLLNSSLNFNYELVKGLSASAQLGFSDWHLEQEQNSPIASMDPTTNPKGQSQFGKGDQNTVIIEPKIEYKGMLGNGKITAMVGGTYQLNTDYSSWLSGGGYVNDNLLHSLSNAPIKNGSTGTFEYKYAAIFGRLNYIWDEKYILNLSARRDGSSRFGPGKQYGNFWAAGAAWIFTEENWLKNHLGILSFGKLRGSYGLTGSDQIDDYKYLTRWNGGVVFPYQGSAAYVPTQHANPLLHWQTNYKLEAAINLGFLKDRFTIELAWYRNRCSDQLISYYLPYLTGFPNVATNFPATVENKGWEMSIGTKLIDKKDLQWTFNFNIGANRNKLLAFPNIEKTPYASSIIVGQPLSIRQVLHYTGVDPQKGTYTFVDKNKDGRIIPYADDPMNDVFPKDMSIKADGGFETNLQYKNWQLNLYFNFRKFELPSAIFAGYPGQVNLNASTQVLDHWQKPGDIARFAKYTTSPDDSYYFYSSSDGVYSDASYLRLKNVSISYSFPEKWFKSGSFQKCSIYVRIQNLFILTRYNGLDPDNDPTFGGLPLAKYFTAGIQFSL